MSATQPGNPKDAANWFGELSTSAKSVKKVFIKSSRETDKAENVVTDAMFLTLQAHMQAYKLVGEKDDDYITIISPSNKDTHRELWISWCKELFDTAYEEFTTQVERGDN